MRVDGLCVTAALALMACGRDECDDVVCRAAIPAAVNSTVMDADGLPLSGVAVQVVEPAGISGSCSPLPPSNAAWLCAVGTAPGHYVIDIVADGHAPQRLEFTSRRIGGCCPTHESFTGTVTLQRTLASP